MTDPALFLNRELSWLEFNSRVLHEAMDERNPLLERLKFLAIFNTNLDEFYMVRVAGLRRQAAAGVLVLSADGMSPTEQLTAIGARVDDLMGRQRSLLYDTLLPQLSRHGVRLVSIDDLTSAEWQTVDEFFEAQVFPVLTPLAVDPGHPFPYISNLSLNLAVMVHDPVTREQRFARLKVPNLLPRFVVLPDGERFVPLEQVIAEHLSSLFPGMVVERHHPFRVTRNADLTLEEDEADDLLAAVEVELRRRRFGRAVRLEVAPDVDSEILATIVRELDIEPDDVYVSGAP